MKICIEIKHRKWWFLLKRENRDIFIGRKWLGRLGNILNIFAAKIEDVPHRQTDVISIYRRAYPLLKINFKRLQVQILRNKLHQLNLEYLRHLVCKYMRNLKNLYKTRKLCKMDTCARLKGVRIKRFYCIAKS